jgi:phage shock protein C
MMKKLYRSRRDRKIFGISGGLADYLNIDSTLIRLIFIILLFPTSGVFGLVYLIAIFVIPEEGEV